MHGKIVLWWLLLLLPGVIRAAAPAARSLCATAETTYFSCAASGHATISLCGVLPGKLQYRYARAGQLLLRFPRSAGQGVQQLRYAHYSRYQTERSEVSFSDAGTDYTLFDYREHGRRSAGVQLTDADGAEHELLCTGPIQGRLAPLAKSLRCDSDSALNGGHCP